MSANYSETPFSSPICKWALPLVARTDNEWYPSGSSIVIAERLAVTAKHVIEDFMNKFGTEKIAPNRYHHKFYLQAAQILENGETGVLWNVSKIWRSGLTDVAFLLLEPTCSDCLSV